MITLIKSFKAMGQVNPLTWANKTVKTNYIYLLILLFQDLNQDRKFTNKLNKLHRRQSSFLSTQWRDQKDKNLH